MRFVLTTSGEMATSTRSHVLSLYRALLREGRKFEDYNYRKYALRRTKDAFYKNKAETNPEKISSFVKEGQHNLEIMRRQVIVGHLYGEGKLVIETKGKSHPG